MKAFTPEWFKPKYQRKGKPAVEFELRPLDQRTLYVLQMNMTRGVAGPDGALAAFDYAVNNWRGYEDEFSQDAKFAVLNGPGETHWTMWLAEIAGHLYKRAYLGEPERKNS
jgi:hypothetical protein